jgi:hypothetical protein
LTSIALDLLWWLGLNLLAHDLRIDNFQLFLLCMELFISLLGFVSSFLFLLNFTFSHNPRLGSFSVKLLLSRLLRLELSLNIL